MMIKTDEGYINTHYILRFKLVKKENYHYTIEIIFSVALSTLFKHEPMQFGLAEEAYNSLINA